LQAIQPAVEAEPTNLIVPKLGRPVVRFSSPTKVLVNVNGTAKSSSTNLASAGEEWSLDEDARISELSMVAYEMDLVFSRVQQYLKGWVSQISHH
jgi:hypothetical protein